MVTQKPDVDSFTEFANANEARLRHALVATCGGEVGGVADGGGPRLRVGALDHPAFCEDFGRPGGLFLHRSW